MANRKPDTTQEPAAQPEAVTSEVQEVLSQVAETARGHVVSTLDEQRERAAEGLGGVANALRETTETLRQKEVAVVNPVIETAAEHVEQLSEYLQSADIDRLAEDVGRFAHRRPAAFIGGAFALGFLGARLLLAGARDDDSKAA